MKSVATVIGTAIMNFIAFVAAGLVFLLSLWLLLTVLEAIFT